MLATILLRNEQAVIRSGAAYRSNYCYPSDNKPQYYRRDYRNRYCAYDCACKRKTFAVAVVILIRFFVADNRTYQACDGHKKRHYEAHYGKDVGLCGFGLLRLLLFNGASAVYAHYGVLVDFVTAILTVHNCLL